MSINEVAKAIVSNATMLRVISRSVSVRPEAVERVTRAMTKVNYVPKPLESRPGSQMNSFHNGIDKHHKQTGIIALVMRMKPSLLAHSPVLASGV